MAKAWHEELRARGYPTRSLFNWRTPLPMWLLGVLPDAALGKALLGVLGLALLLLAFAWLADEANTPTALLGTLALSGALLPCLLGDLFVMPNVMVPGDMEGQGLVLLEAALCGRPAIAAAMEGILDVVTEGANGHLVPTEDAAGFAEAITRYAADRPALAAFSERARTHVGQHDGRRGARFGCLS